MVATMHTPGTTILGLKKAALWTPGATILGDRENDGEPVPDIINLTLATLDPRLTYTGPAHYYFNSAGVLTLSAENEWPVEYRNGVPIGRHEPEPAAVNLFNISSVTFGRATLQQTTGKIGLPGWELTETVAAGAHYMSPYLAVNQGDTLTFSAFAEQTEQSRDYAFFVLANSLIAPAFCIEYVSFSDASISWGNDPSLSGVSASADVVFPGILTTSSTMTATKSSTAQNIMELGSVIDPSTPSYTGDTAYSVIFSGIQIEAGALRTSPIAATDGTASRAASSVTLDTTGVSYIVVGYSDGSSNNYDTPDENFIIPIASRNWGERYISAIEVIA